MVCVLRVRTLYGLRFRITFRIAFFRFDAMKWQGLYTVISRNITTTPGISPRETFLALSSGSTTFDTNLTAAVNFGSEYKAEAETDTMDSAFENACGSRLNSPQAMKFKPSRTGQGLYTNIKRLEKTLPDVREAMRPCQLEREHREDMAVFCAPRHNSKC